MTAEYYPLQVLLFALSGWVNRLRVDTRKWILAKLAGTHHALDSLSRG